MRNLSTDDLIAQLANHPAPVAPMRLGIGAIWVAGALAVTLCLVTAWDGIAVHTARGPEVSLVLLTNIMLGLLGLSATFAALHMARPQAGARRDAPKWALAMVAVLPIVALFDGVMHTQAAPFWQDVHGPACLLQSTMASVLVMAALTLWVRQGAPANPRLAMAYIAIASGALGSLAYGLSCPLFDMAHLFTWHAMTPIMMSAVAYFGLPHVLRW